MIDIAGTPLVDPSVCKILKLIKNNTYHSLWRIWKAVWLLPEKVHVTSVNGFKSSRSKLLALSGVTKCLNSWNFVTDFYFNSLLLWKTYVQKLISTCDFWQRFCYIVLRKFNYYFIFLLNLVCLELREGFYYFTLITNPCLFSLRTHSTLPYYTF